MNECKNLVKMEGNDENSLCLLCSSKTYQEKRAVLWCGELTTLGNTLTKFLEIKIENYIEKQKSVFCCIACKRKLITVNGKVEELRRVFDEVHRERQTCREKRPREPADPVPLLPARKKAILQMSVEENLKPESLTSSAAPPALSMLSTVNKDGSLTTSTIPENVSGLIQAASHGNLDKIVKYILQHKEMNSLLMSNLMSTVDKQCEYICSLQNESRLRQKDVVNFCADVFLNEEIKEKCPLLWDMAHTIACPTKASKRNVFKTDESKTPAIAMAIAILFKTRNKNLNCMQTINSLIMAKSQVKEQVFTRLNKLGICESYKQTSAVLDKLADHHDEKVKHWVSTKQPIKMAGDNVDKRIKPRDERSDNQNQDLHWFVTVAFKERISFTALPDDKPQANLSELPLTEFLVSDGENNTLKRNMSVLLLRAICHSLPFLKGYKKYVPSHISHTYSNEMSQKTECVNLGIIPENSNTSEGMMHILENLHQYINKSKEPTVFGGDQLTEERANGVQRLRRTATSRESRLAGFLPTAESWHAKMAFLKVMFTHLWSKGKKDMGTLSQLASATCRSSVTGDVKKEMNQTCDFIDDVTNAHCIVSAMKYFGLKTTEDMPAKHLPPDPSRSSFEKKTWLYKCAEEIIDSYVMADVEKNKKRAQNPIEDEKRTEKNILNKRISTHSGTEGDYPYLPWTRGNSKSQPPVTSEQPTEDGVFNYACSLFFFGMIFKEFNDCIREGDAEREVVCWKILLLLFRIKFRGKCNRIKYAYTAFKYLCQVKATLSERMAEKLKWGRYVNSSGGRGNNIPCDLRIEHEVRNLKNRFDSLGKNLTPSTAQKIARSQTKLDEVVTSFDVHTKTPSPTVGHTTVSSELDVDIMVNDLLLADVFSKKPGRYHSSFTDQLSSPISNLDMADTLRWMKTLVKKFSSSNLALHEDVSDEESSDSELSD